FVTRPAGRAIGGISGAVCKSTERASLNCGLIPASCAHAVTAAAMETASIAPLAAAHHHTRARFSRDMFASLKDPLIANAIRFITGVASYVPRAGSAMLDDADAGGPQARGRAGDLAGQHPDLVGLAALGRGRVGRDG